MNGGAGATGGDAGGGQGGTEGGQGGEPGTQVSRCGPGNYDAGEGLCGECGEPIGRERLKARPVTTLCIECKAAQEERERPAPR